MKIINYNMYIATRRTDRFDFGGPALSRKFLLLAFLASSQMAAAQGADPYERIRAARVQLETCFKEQITKLGRGNHETAETLLLAVRSLCEEQDSALGWAYAGLRSIRTSDMRALRAKDREDSENAAVAALLVARAEVQPGE